MAVGRLALAAYFWISGQLVPVLPGWTLEWQGPFDNEFVGASVSVVLLIADKP